MPRFKEAYYAYRFNKVVDNSSYSSPTGARHDGRHFMGTTEDITSFIARNIEQYPEIRIIDVFDSLVMHVVNKTLLFPLPKGVSKNNTWDAANRRFQEN